MADSSGHMAEPKCVYFGKCGGCSFQHIDYPAQLENKQKTLFNAINYSGIKVFSGNEYSYRNRMDMVFHPGGIGFREKGTWKRVVDVEKCEVSNLKLNQLISEIRDFFGNGIDSFDLVKHNGTFRYAVIRSPENDSAVSFVLNADSSQLDSAIEKIKEFSKRTSANSILVARVPKNSDVSISPDYFVVKGPESISETFQDKKFNFPVQGFFQNNYAMASEMHSYVNCLLKKHETNDAHLLDLYAGVGTFGIINSALFKDVKIVESEGPSIECAKKNLEENKINNAEAIALDAKYLKRIAPEKPLFVITDPPRSGMHPKTMQHLNELKPEVIFYVSCNANQLGKDLPKFRDYEIKSAALFDLFPQTPHFESVVELALR